MKNKKTNKFLVGISLITLFLLLSFTAYLVAPDGQITAFFNKVEENHFGVPWGTPYDESPVRSKDMSEYIYGPVYFAALYENQEFIGGQYTSRHDALTNRPISKNQKIEITLIFRSWIERMEEIYGKHQATFIRKGIKTYEFSESQPLFEVISILDNGGDINYIWIDEPSQTIIEVVLKGKINDRWDLYMAHTYLESKRGRAFHRSAKPWL